MTYLVLKSLHVVTAMASISGFLLRGYWMLRDSVTLQRRIVRIAAVSSFAYVVGVALAKSPLSWVAWLAA